MSLPSALRHPRLRQTVVATGSSFVFLIVFAIGCVAWPPPRALMLIDLAIIALAAILAVPFRQLSDEGAAALGSSTALVATFAVLAF